MSTSVKYRISGFENGLNWRETAFQIPLPENRVCGLCGIVPKELALLTCRHGLCGSCYGGCVDQGNLCPLDGKLFEEDFVEWLHFADEQLAKRNVSSTFVHTRSVLGGDETRTGNAFSRWFSM